VSPINDVDLDRLADYTAGLLDPQDRQQVDELIRTDPEWRHAYQALTAAQPALTAALTELRDAPLPADVGARLDSALAEAGAAAPGTAKVIDISRRRRWTRLAAGTTAAAAVVAAIFAGVIALSNAGPFPAGNSNRSGQGAGAPAAGQAESQLSAAVPVVLHTDTDYTPQNLSTAADATGTGTTSNPGPGPGVAGPQKDNSVEGGLTRLTNPQALRECLSAVVARHGGTPSVVDYARFQGRPALIVVLVGSGPRQIVVTGPECGVAGAAELFATTG